MIEVTKLKLSLAEVNVLEFHNQLDKYVFDILHQNNTSYFKAVENQRGPITCYGAFDWSSNTLTCNIILVKIQLLELIPKITFIYELPTPFLCILD